MNKVIESISKQRTQQVLNVCFCTFMGSSERMEKTKEENKNQTPKRSTKRDQFD